MKLRLTQDAALGGVVLLFGLFVAVIWAPLDSDTGLVERIRGRWTIGDALAPTMAGLLLAVSGLALSVSSLRRPGRNLLAIRNLQFILSAATCVAAALLVMRYAGPLIASITVGEYRPLRDTAPWKYLGFVLGGGILVVGLGFIAEGRTNWRRIALTILGLLVLALAYDLPFEDLLLPPNGDV